MASGLGLATTLLLRTLLFDPPSNRYVTESVRIPPMLYWPAAELSGLVLVTPGWVAKRSSVLRPFSGSSYTACPMTVPPTVEFSVSTCDPTLSTVTVLVADPTCICTSTRKVWLMFRGVCVSMVVN